MRLLWYALTLLCTLQALPAEPGWRERFQQQHSQTRASRSPGQEELWAGHRVAIWRPKAGCAPLVVFSHGYHGNPNQSSRLCKSLAEAGYLVVAVEHKDARLGSGGPEVSMRHTDTWTESTYKDRRDDLVSVLHFLRTDPVWAARVDWSLGVALMGHSLGGYTVFGTAGAWPGWRQQECKISAVIGLSPYLSGLRGGGQLKHLGVPALFQTGSLDLGVKPSLLHGGLFAATQSPAYYVEFRRAGHLAWTDLNGHNQEAIAHYCKAFLDRYLKQDQSVDLTERWPEVVELRSK
ncbi:alpha/beta hydrolase [bacterium]|nr:alpha/beta hydrolase [bacterium]